MITTNQHFFIHKNNIMKQNSKNKTQTRQQSKSSSGNNGRAANNTGSNGKQSPAKNSNKESLLEKLFTDQLKDMYYAEQALLKALPKMAQACTTEELEDAFNEHL